MSGDRIKGLAETYALFGRVPNAAHEQLGVELAIVGREILAAQQAAVPKGETGALESALSLQLVLDRLRVRIGLLGGRDASRFNGRNRKASAGGPFYGRIVEFGRRAQTVLVTRRLKAVRKTGNNRNGNTRRTIYAGKPYSLRVKAMEGRPFVQQPLLEEVATSTVADFWAQTLARAETGA